MKLLVATVILMMGGALAGALYLAANPNAYDGEPFASIAIEGPREISRSTPAARTNTPKPQDLEARPQPGRVTVTPSGDVNYAPSPPKSAERPAVVSVPGVTIGTPGITVSVPPADGN